MKSLGNKAENFKKFIWNDGIWEEALDGIKTGYQILYELMG